MSDNTNLLERLQKQCTYRLERQRSAIVTAPAESIDDIGTYLAGRITQLGYWIMVIDEGVSDVSLSHRPNPQQDVVFLVFLRRAPDSRLGRFLKYGADDFRRRRAGYNLPTGEFVSEPQPIRCCWVITTPAVMEEWYRKDRQAYAAVIDYYAVIEV